MRGSMKRYGTSIASLAIFAIVRPSAARACEDGHGQYPRPPVEWMSDDEPAPCMTLVDRSVDPVLHLEYEIGSEDVCAEPSVPDDRTHEFFGFCRDHRPYTFLPNWITAADAVGEPGVDAEDVLETAMDWSECFFPLDEVGRRPVTFEQAEQGVDWDTSQVAPGTYVLAGYTYEPPLNLWSERQGVVKVHDGDPDAVGPAVAIAVDVDGTTAYRDETIEISGCVDALAGSDLAFSWALAGDDSPWHPLLTVVPDDDVFTVSFVPSEDMWGEQLVLRVEVVDPMARSGTAYLDSSIIVVDADTPAATTGPGDGTHGEGTSGAATQGDDGTGGSPSESMPESSGCGCAAPGAAPRAGGGLLLVFLGARRRRPSSAETDRRDL